MESGTAVRHLSPGHVLFEQGDRADDAYQITQGSIRIETEAHGTVTVLAVLREGQILGEMALFDGGPRSARAVAGPHGARVRRLSREQFEAFLHDPLLRELVRDMAQRLREADKTVGTLSAAESARRSYLEHMRIGRDRVA